MNQKNSQEQEEAVGARVLTVLSTLIDVANIEFSLKHNALYGIKEFTAILCTMAKNKMSSREAVKEIRTGGRKPTAKWFRNMMHSMSENDALRLCDDMLKHTMKRALKASKG